MIGNSLFFLNFIFLCIKSIFVICMDYFYFYVKNKTITDVGIEILSQG